ncbi:DUF6520 family protein [Flavobacterium sp.]|uniref:DUF6520 family protein n=1 Tax=Flavobacterium sp. TaxID=239 RepID=UPI004034AA0A
MQLKKHKTVLPAFALLLAVFSAFAFKSVGDEQLLAPENGWINLPTEPCAIQVQCDNTITQFVCTGIYQGITYQAFGKTAPLRCNKVLYRPL